MSNKVFKNLSIGITFLCFSIFVILPMLLLILISFTENIVKGQELSFTLDNYLRILDPIYLKIFFNSLLCATYMTLICLLLGYPFAYIITQLPAQLQSFLLLLSIIPFWTSSLIRTYAIVIMLKTNGLVNSMLLKIGLIDKPLELLYNQTAIVIGLIFSLLPFLILPLYSSLKRLNRDYIDAAYDLGANTFSVFRQIIIPLSMHGIITASMLVFIPVLGGFFIADLLGGSKNIFIGNLIKNQFMFTHNLSFGAAISVVLLAVTLLILLFARNAFIKTRGTIIR